MDIDSYLFEYMKRCVEKKPYKKKFNKTGLIHKSIIIHRAYNLLNSGINIKQQNCLKRLITILEQTPPISMEFEIIKLNYNTYEIILNIDLDVENIGSQILTLSFILNRIQGNIIIENNIYPINLFNDVSMAINNYLDFYLDLTHDISISIKNRVLLITSNSSEIYIELTDLNNSIFSKEFKRIGYLIKKNI